MDTARPSRQSSKEVHSARAGLCSYPSAIPHGRGSGEHRCPGHGSVSDQGSWAATSTSPSCLSSVCGGDNNQSKNNPKAGLFVPAELCLEIKITRPCSPASSPGRWQDEAQSDQGSLRIVLPSCSTSKLRGLQQHAKRDTSVCTLLWQPIPQLGKSQDERARGTRLPSLPSKVTQPEEQDLLFSASTALIYTYSHASTGTKHTCRCRSQPCGSLCGLCNSPKKSFT